MVKMSWKVCLLFTTLFACLIPISAEFLQFSCSEEGRFAHPSNCTSYVECIFNSKKGDFEAKSGTCGKGGFDPKQRKCVALKDIKNCHSRTGRLVKIHPEYNHVCDGNSGFYCGDCNTLINCINGAALSEVCDPHYFCQYRYSFSGAAVCYPHPPEECVCQESNIFKPDPHNEKAFFFCDSFASTTFYLCPGEMVYDKYMEQCVHPEGLPPCTEVGVFAHEKDCRQYYTCIPAVYTRWVQKLFYCDYMTMYSERNNRCEKPCRWVRRGFTCEEEGRFPDKTDCQAFFECIKIDGDDEFRMMKRKCPDDFHWEEDFPGSNKGFCISVKRSKCEAFVPTNCDVPPDWCEGEMDVNLLFSETSLVDGEAAENDQTTLVPDVTTMNTDDEDLPPDVTMQITVTMADANAMPTLVTEVVTQDDVTEVSGVPTVDPVDVEEISNPTVGQSEAEEDVTYNPLVFPQSVTESEGIENEIDSLSHPSNVRNFNRVLYEV